MRRLIATTVLATLACGGGGGDAGTSDGGGAAAVAPLGSASIAGVINFEGAPPANPTIDMAEEPDCVAKYTDGPIDPIVVVNDGKLANVYVRIVSGLPEGPYPMLSEPAVIDQDGCLYHPRVLGAMVGQPIEIRNSDPMLHNIKAIPTENRGFNISQPREGMTTTRRFRVPEIMIPLECNVHGWMNAYVGITDHPYFATSGEDGTFAIGGLPAGTYQLEAWHETLGTLTAEVTISDGAAETVDFSFSG